MPRTIPIFAQNSAFTAAGLEFRKSPALSLYVHIPWCVQKCPYCDFNSHEADGGIPERAYVDALIADLQSALPLIWGRPVQTVFFGGGTPSLLSPAAIDELIAAFRALAMLTPDAEITLEANPGTVEAEKFAGFRAAGINRLSLGIQSFNDEHLKALGRIHGSAEARRAAQLAGEHFERFNLDLMYGLPGQTLEQARTDIESALSFSPPHLSCYQLTLEPNTRFAAFPPVLPEGDICADMQDAIDARLAAAGYSNYETSAFAQAGRQCLHNLNYWHFGDYLGIGAGAHSKLTLHDRVLRQMRHKHPKAYLDNVRAGTPVQEENQVSAASLPFEFMMNALRLTDGFAPSLFELRTAQPLSSILSRLRQAEADGLLTNGPDKIAPTAKGRRFLNVLLERFLTD
ncbi:radical SAM family heme chaperone HemW [Dechloromonas sp.]|uniref:radical SAM family heme chaperone HemW n=1 Tax=Dechloromonas sp. TaxID=1917218 RepID=UPI0011FEF585|nr:radical SAM family heme chaperone HemW [Dechloromonas sp.]MBU3696938.1 oxygen-independent coproporphyrinogen III oxidase-like protein [Dechloromonas sp.]TEX49318.1 MAG: YggW family oxidoreductase [Rhodocyclaceae bacterium]